MQKIVTDLTDINYYRFSKEYRNAKDELTKLQKLLYDKEVEMLRIKQKIVELNDKLRKCESNILNDIERRENGSKSRR